MGEVIFVQFGDRPKITGRDYADAIERLEWEAVRQPPRTAEQLRRLAREFEKRAEGGGL